LLAVVAFPRAVICRLEIIICILYIKKLNMFLRENWSDVLFFVLLMVVYVIVVTVKNGADKSTVNGEKKTVKTIVFETFLG
jgi:hypothetical protein